MTVECFRSTKLGTLSTSRDLTGALIADKYELLRLIGRGGMGAVYEARNVTTLRRGKGAAVARAGR